jgi:hypothetical protein
MVEPNESNELNNNVKQIIGLLLETENIKKIYENNKNIPDSKLLITNLLLEKPEIQQIFLEFSDDTKPLDDTAIKKISDIFEKITIPIDRLNDQPAALPVDQPTVPPVDQPTVPPVGQSTTTDVGKTTTEQNDQSMTKQDGQSTTEQVGQSTTTSANQSTTINNMDGFEFLKNEIINAVDKKPIQMQNNQKSMPLNGQPYGQPYNTSLTEFLKEKYRLFPLNLNNTEQEYISICNLCDTIHNLQFKHLKKIISIKDSKNNAKTEDIENYEHLNHSRIRQNINFILNTFVQNRPVYNRGTAKQYYVQVRYIFGEFMIEKIKTYLTIIHKIVTENDEYQNSEFFDVDTSIKKAKNVIYNVFRLATYIEKTQKEHFNKNGGTRRTGRRIMNKKTRKFIPLNNQIRMAD